MTNYCLVGRKIMDDMPAFAQNARLLHFWKGNSRPISERLRLPPVVTEEMPQRLLCPHREVLEVSSVLVPSLVFLIGVSLSSV